MEAMTSSLFEAVEVAGERTWACSMRKRRSCGDGGHARCGDDVGVGSRVRVAYGWQVGDLLGDAEGVEGHVVGAVADGVEAELEAGGGAFGGHLVELVLVVAGEAGVAGVVGVGRVHGGGAGAEGAVHEALEHARVWRRGSLAGWLARRCFEDVDGGG